jgi:alpha-D-ribose 1-methylphosphonate 5-triphosphate diphosphatase PhnM
MRPVRAAGAAIMNRYILTNTRIVLPHRTVECSVVVDGDRIVDIHTDELERESRPAGLSRLMETALARHFLHVRWNTNFGPVDGVLASDATVAHRLGNLVYSESIMGAPSSPTPTSSSATSRGSHDDTTVEHVLEAHLMAATLAEMPTTLVAARTAKRLEMQVCMGAPNYRGGSHCNNLSCEEAIAEREDDGSQQRWKVIVAAQNVDQPHELVAG